MKMMSKTRSVIAAAVAAQTALARVSRGALCSGVKVTGGDCLGLFGGGEVDPLSLHLPSVESVGWHSCGIRGLCWPFTRADAPTAVRSVPCGRRPAVSQRGGCRFGGDELA
jgi:hypothetical protein